jgi:hypothetical protein
VPESSDQPTSCYRARSSPDISHLPPDNSLDTKVPAESPSRALPAAPAKSPRFRKHRLSRGSLVPDSGNIVYPVAHSQPEASAHDSCGSHLRRGFPSSSPPNSRRGCSTSTRSERNHSRFQPSIRRNQPDSASNSRSPPTIRSIPHATPSRRNAHEFQHHHEKGPPDSHRPRQDRSASRRLIRSTMLKEKSPTTRTVMLTSPTPVHERQQH